MGTESVPAWVLRLIGGWSNVSMKTRSVGRNRILVHRFVLIAEFEFN